MSFHCPEGGKEAKDAVIHPQSSVSTPKWKAIRAGLQQHTVVKGLHSTHLRAFEMPLCQRPGFGTRTLYFITHPLAENFPWKAQDVRKWWLRPRNSVIALWLIGVTLGFTGCTVQNWDSYYWGECEREMTSITSAGMAWIVLSWVVSSSWSLPLWLDGVLFWPVMTALLHVSGSNNSLVGYTVLGIYMAVHFMVVDGFHYGNVEMASASVWFCAWVGASCGGIATGDQIARQGSAAILGTLLCAQVMVLRQQRRWSEGYSMDNPLQPPPQSAEGLRALSVLSVVVCIVVSMLLIFSGKSLHEVITAVLMTCFSLLRHGFIVDESTSKSKSKQHEAIAAEDLTSSLLVAAHSSKTLSDLQHKVSDAFGTWSAMCKIAIVNSFVSIGSVSLSMWFGRIPGEARFGAPFTPRGTALAAISVASFIVILCGSNLGHEAGYKWAVIQDPSFRMTSTLKAAQMALKLDVTFRSGLMRAVKVNHTQQACNQRMPTYNATALPIEYHGNVNGNGTCAPCGRGSAHGVWELNPVVHNQVLFMEPYPMPGSKVIGCDIFGVCADTDWPSCAKVDAPDCPSEEFLMSGYDTRNAEAFSSDCWTPYVCTPELLCMVDDASSHATRDWWLHNALIFSTASSLMVTVMLTLSNVFKDKALKQLRLKSQRPKVARAAYCTAWVSSKAGLGFLIIGAKWGPSSILWTHKSDSGQHFADVRTTGMVLVIAIILGMTSMVTNELARVCEDPKERFSAAETGAGVQAISVVIAGIAGGAVFLSVMTYTNAAFQRMFQIHGGTPGIFTVLAQLGALGVFGSSLVLVWAFTHSLEPQGTLPTFDEYRAKTGWFPEFSRRSRCFRWTYSIVIALLVAFIWTFSLPLSEIYNHLALG